MPTMSWGRRVFVFVAAAVVLVVGAAPAQAVTTMTTSTAVTDDYAFAEFYITTVRPHYAHFMGAVWDRCGEDGKGDGAGAYMRGQVLFASGDYSPWSEWQGDSNGCGNSGTTFDDGFDRPNRTIIAMRMQLCERDNGTAVECSTRTFG